MSSSSHQENAAQLLEILNTTANVEINDDATHSLFGDLYSGQQILEALIEAATTTTTTSINANQQDNVGMPVAVPDDNTTANSSSMVTRSLDKPWTTFLSMQMEIITPCEMIPLEIHNLCSNNVTLRLRWINQNGGFNVDTHTWDITSQSTFEQYCQPGHLFVLSVSDNNSNSEQILGAYRPNRLLPSLTAHALLVQEISPCLFLLETILLDATRFDALTVAAADLDYHYSYHQDRESLQQTIHLLHTIVKNVILHHPNDEKYHQLKLANAKMSQYIVNSCWGAMEMLKILGFVEKTMVTTTTTTTSSSSSSSCSENHHHVVDDDNEKKNHNTEQYFVMATPTPQSSLDIGQHALHLLDILQNRVSTQFVAELAPPTPWQPPPPAVGNSSSIGGQDSVSWGQRRDFVITDEERWARAERVARLRRSGGGRRPSPGNAPSSRGKWGR